MKDQWQLCSSLGNKYRGAKITELLVEHTKHLEISINDPRDRFCRLEDLTHLLRPQLLKWLLFYHKKDGGDRGISRTLFCFSLNKHHHANARFELLRLKLVEKLVGVHYGDSNWNRARFNQIENHQQKQAIVLTKLKRTYKPAGIPREKIVWNGKWKWWIEK